MSEDHERRPSWPYPAVWFLCVLIWAATPFVGTTVAALAFALLMGVCTWSALSVKAYESMKDTYPDLSRGDYVLNSLLLPVVVPVVIVLGWLAFRMVIGSSA